ncbi:small GTP-binding protein domain-containing protein [Cryptosporidium muris RN66]|uniref:ADP-ribosylation factor-like protein 2 n=1 Tax=Cryptosporidium muris (strain RN66) TaxID=441375 RepID=B6AFW0_CRYMR|nr:small GTP-binding protein domain-containing protein [Cryptosporidium muris RN66]EEA07101.1 small GTP-binding protein domain-containing protein [Cryptosporidium muris RN66]|eukprot:XP_002141450.1 small GTP-binding protein domain-containing protein [Cryptosporidium muris RN66]
MVLLQVIRKTRMKDREIRVLVLGLDNAGKTTFVRKFAGEDVSIIQPTLGFNIKTLVYGSYRLNTWDIGGQKTIRSYWRNYFECTDGIIWVVDSTNLERFDTCSNELQQLLVEERLSGVSLLVLANKQDLPNALNVEEISQALNLESIKSRNWRIQPCCAVQGDGLNEGIEWIVNDIATRIFSTKSSK